MSVDAPLEQVVSVPLREEAGVNWVEASAEGKRLGDWRRRGVEGAGDERHRVACRYDMRELDVDGSAVEWRRDGHGVGGRRERARVRR